jgi:hypothetical protein
MTEQEERQTSIEYLIKKLYQLERDLIELEKQHEQSLKVAFEKGYENGIKYNDRIWQRRISILKNYHERV